MRPFLKWAGGKRQLLDEIVPLLTPRPITGRYIEPFVGGGAVALELVRRRLVEPNNVWIGDRNPDLWLVWRHVIGDPGGVAAALGRFPAPTERNFYLVRDGRAQLSEAERAARVIWLNRYTFNGLHRTNRAGKLNMPWGKNERASVDVGNVYAVGVAMAGARVSVGDAVDLVNAARAGDVVYLDPPYWPTSSSSFTGYDGQPFGEAEHRKLARALRLAEARGVWWVLSSSDAADARRLYRACDWHVFEVAATRRINRDADGRGPVVELLVTPTGLGRFGG